MSAVLHETCALCGLVQAVPRPPEGHEPVCARCEHGLPDPWRRSLDPTPTFATALAALILYPVALSLPILSLERFGHQSEASIWSGSVGLLRGGQLFVGTVVLLCSVVLPFLKLVSLLLLTGMGGRLAQRHRARTWHLLELAGRWGMLDVLLIALLVAWLKLGDLVSVTPGPGAVAFTLCVVLSLVASALYDPRSHWLEPGESPDVPDGPEGAEVSP